MKLHPLLILVSLVILSGASCHSPSPSETPSPATDLESANEGNAAKGSAPGDDWVVMTWNLEWFYDENTGDNFGELPKQQSAPSRSAWNWRRDAVADAIAKAEPDVLAVQEVEGQRVLFYLTGAIDRRHQLQYAIGFSEGGDYATEQDVGFLYGTRADLTRLSRYRPTRSMLETGQYGNVTKHVEATFDVPVGDASEKVTVMTIHLRAGADNAGIRTRQARSVHDWLAQRIAAGEQVIVLGDTNSGSTTYPADEESDIAALAGLSTPAADDDLIDLHQHLPPDQRPTHLRRDKHLDRILVSRSLIEDTPGRPDLVFRSIQRQQQLAVRGDGVDSPGEHGDHYWQMPDDQRDLSDHWPLVARFEVK